MKTAKKNSAFRLQFNDFMSNNILNDHEIVIYGVIISILLKTRESLNLNLLYRKVPNDKNGNFNYFSETFSNSLKKENLQEIKINWNSFDNLNLECKNRITPCDITLHFEFMINLARGHIGPDIFEKALRIANISSSFLLPLLIKEEKQIISQRHLIHKKNIPPTTEIVHIIEKNLKNGQKNIIPINANLVSIENFKKILQFLEELSLDSVNMADVVSALTTNK
jgi:hypothetical protein